MANKRILIRRDTTANWQAINPTLGSGELGIEVKTDGSRSMKAGTGSSAWNSLPYLVDSPIQLSMLVSHQNDTAAHGATSVPAANKTASYGSSAGLKSDKIPLESNDVLRKAELDSLNTSVGEDISGLDERIDELGGSLEGETELRETDVAGIKGRLVTLESGAALRGVAGTCADLPAPGGWNTGDAFIVEEDETRGGVSAVYAVAVETSGTGNEGDPVVETKVWQYRAVFTVDMNGKLDKANNEDELDRAYIVTSGGEQGLYAIDQADDTPDTLARRGSYGEIKTADPAQDEDAANKKYVDGAVAAAQLATHTWKPAVETKADLPDPETLTATLNYLCRVIADTETPSNNGVWELIAGAEEWTYFSDNADWVDTLELGGAIGEHDADSAAHGSLFGAKLGKLTSGSDTMAYTHTGESQGEKKVDEFANANTIALRDDEGKLNVAGGTTGNHAVNFTQLDEEVTRATGRENAIEGKLYGRYVIWRNYANGGCLAIDLGTAQNKMYALEVYLSKATSSLRFTMSFYWGDDADVESLRFRHIVFQPEYQGFGNLVLVPSINANQGLK